MRIWADNVKVGDEIWYKSSSGFRFSKVVKKDFKTFLMPSLLMENRDRLFVNEWVYESWEDISKEKIETLITYQESVIKECEKEIQTNQMKITRISKDIQELKNLEDNEHEEYAQYAQYLSTPAVPVSTEKLLQCTKDIINYCVLKTGRFEDKLPEIKYMSEEELMKYLIKTSNKS